MSTPLIEALSQLKLEPGQSHRVSVNGHKVEICCVKEEEGCDSREGEMVDLWLEIPASPLAKTLIVRRGEPMLPNPLELDESDLAPE